MVEFPEIPGQDFFLALASAGVLLWLALYLANPSDEETDLFVDGLLKPPPGTGTRRHLSFLGALFTQILVVASIPLLEVIFHATLPLEPRQYDMVVLQFSRPEKPFRVPAGIREILAPEKSIPPDADALQAPDVESPESKSENKASGDLESGDGGPSEDVERGPLAPQRAVVEIVVPDMPPPTALGEFDVPTPEVAVSLAEVLRAAEAMMLDAERTPLEDYFNSNVPSLADLGISLPDIGDSGELPPLPPAALMGMNHMPLSIGILNGQSVPLGDPWFLAGGPGFDPNSLVWGSQDALPGWPNEKAGGGAGAGEGNGGDGSDGTSGWGRGGNRRGLGLGSGTPAPRKYHGIILISNSRSAMPEAEGVLKGNPVYTVYVEVPGAPRRWVLQFCENKPDAPGSLEYGDGGGVIRVNRRRRIDLPFALRRSDIEFDRDDEKLRDLPRRLVVYATLSEEGQLDNFRIVSGGDKEIEPTIIAGLQNWEFSPAFRDGRPVAVEALFGIPLR